MNVEDRDERGGTTTLSLAAGPLHEALHEITRAKEAIEVAKADVERRRGDFAELLRSTLHDAEDLDEEAAVEVIGELYWDHDQVRVADLTAATGLSSTQLKRVAGNQRVEAPCRRCQAPTEVLRTSRSGTPSGLCPACREFEELQWLAQARQDPLAYAPFDEPWSSAGLDDLPPPTSTSVRVTDLRRLVEHLERLLSSQQCDNALTHTRRWARREGLSVGAVEAAVKGRGGYCDCEVVLNVAL